MRLASAGIAFRRFDIRHAPLQDTRNRQSLENALEGVAGVVHLAAVSRVIWGERDPVTCHATNVTALQSLVDLCATGARPWIVFASSREVYGIVQQLPVQEQAPLRRSTSMAAVN
jgi:UDP-glucose 4-epimerase